MILLNSMELFTYLEKLVKDNPSATVDIASYNMYLSISKGTDWSIKYPSEVRTFINSITDKSKLRMIIGVPQYYPCKIGCEDCRTNHNILLQRLRDSKSRLGLNLRYTDTNHLKYYRVGDRVFLGGINLSVSKFIDAVIEVTDEDDKNKLAELFEYTWNSLTTDDIELIK